MIFFIIGESIGAFILNKLADYTIFIIKSIGQLDIAIEIRHFYNIVRAVVLINQTVTIGILSCIS